MVAEAIDPFSRPSATSRWTARIRWRERRIGAEAKRGENGKTTLIWLLAATAAISLVVGGVGIMNIMLVSVSERTREIGLRRAIGARERDILAQFLAEAIMLCAAAGCIGLALGVAGGYAVASASDWPLAISAQSVALALVASVGVGIVFGYLPARRAATMDPIDALRRE